MSGQMEHYLFHRGEYRQAYEYFGAQIRNIVELLFGCAPKYS